MVMKRQRSERGGRRKCREEGRRRQKRGRVKEEESTERGSTGERREGESRQKQKEKGGAAVVEEGTGAKCRGGARANSRRAGPGSRDLCVEGSGRGKKEKN